MDIKHYVLTKRWHFWIPSFLVPLFIKPTIYKQVDPLSVPEIVKDANGAIVIDCAFSYKNKE